MGPGKSFTRIVSLISIRRNCAKAETIATSNPGSSSARFIRCSRELSRMLPTFVWSGEDIDRLEEWWSKRIEQLIAMKKPLAASALFDEFQLEQKSNYPRPD